MFVFTYNYVIYLLQIHKYFRSDVLHQTINLIFSILFLTDKNWEGNLQFFSNDLSRKKSGFSLYSSVFQPFSRSGTSQKYLIILQNLNAPYSTIYSIFREPSKELAEPRLKNTALQYTVVYFPHSVPKLGTINYSILEIPLSC